MHSINHLLICRCCAFLVRCRIYTRLTYGFYLSMLVQPFLIIERRLFLHRCSFNSCGFVIIAGDRKRNENFVKKSVHFESKVSSYFDIKIVFIMSKIKLVLIVVTVLSIVGTVLIYGVMRDVEICTAPLKTNGTCGNGSPQNPFQICKGKVNAVITSSGRFACIQDPDPVRGCQIPCPVRTKIAKN